MKASQSNKILAHLKRAPLTSLQALRLYGTLRLGARIWELKRSGHRIVSQMVTVTNRDGKARVASYKLV